MVKDVFKYLDNNKNYQKIRDHRNYAVYFSNNEKLDQIIFVNKSFDTNIDYNHLINELRLFILQEQGINAKVLLVNCMFMVDLAYNFPKDKNLAKLFTKYLSNQEKTLFEKLQDSKPQYLTVGILLGLLLINCIAFVTNNQFNLFNHFGMIASDIYQANQFYRLLTGLFFTTDLITTAIYLLASIYCVLYILMGKISYNSSIRSQSSFLFNIFIIYLISNLLLVYFNYPLVDDNYEILFMIIYIQAYFADFFNTQFRVMNRYNYFSVALGIFFVLSVLGNIYMSNWQFATIFLAINILFIYLNSQIPHQLIRLIYLISLLMIVIPAFIYQTNHFFIDRNKLEQWSISCQYTRDTNCQTIYQRLIDE